MFVSKVAGKFTMWNNDQSQDWLSSLPKFFECEKDAIDLWFIPAVSRKAFAKELINPMEISINGNVLTGARKTGAELPLEVVLTFPVTPIGAWPYDEAGKFIGFSEIA